MSRSGKPPQPVEGGQCVCRDGKPAMKDGIFCSDHELLWIAHAGAPSHKLKRKYKKLFAQFMKMYRVKGIDIYREYFNGLRPGKSWGDLISKDLDRISQYMRRISGVQPATLRSASEGLEGDQS